MHLPTLFTALTLATLSQTFSIPFSWKRDDNAKVGSAIITNNCLDPIYMWSVGSSPGRQIRVKPQNAWEESYRVDPDTGIAIKITAVKNGLYSSAPQLTLGYDLNQEAERLYYDLSEKDGPLFKGQPVTLFASGAGGDGGDGQEVEVQWRNGVPPHGMATRVLSPYRDLNLTLC